MEYQSKFLWEEPRNPNLRYQVKQTPTLLLKRTFIYNNPNSGTNAVLMRNPPYHIKDASDFEPLFPPQEFILEESLRREAERQAHQENLMNRVVYDCIDPSPYT